MLYGYEDTINYQKVVVETDPNLIETASRYVGFSNQVGHIYNVS